MAGSVELPAAPFSHMRMRGLAGRLESSFDTKTQVANAMGLAVALPSLRSPSSIGGAGELSASPTGRPAARNSYGGGDRPSGRSQPPLPGASPTNSVQPGDIAATMVELNSLRSQIAGVETVLGLLRSRDEGDVTTMGRKAPRPATQAQLRKRADMTASLPRTGFSSTGGLRTRSATSTSEMDSRSNVSDSGFNSLVGAQGEPGRVGRTWRQPNAVLPVGRGEAVILSAALDETMPAGAMTGKYTMLRESGHTGGVAEAFLAHQDIRKDFQAIDMVQAEAARQVSAACVERGDLVEKVRQRYEELFASLSFLSSSLLDSNASLTHRLAAAEAHGRDQRSRLKTLEGVLRDKDTEMGQVQDTLATQTAAVEANAWDTDQLVYKVQGQNTILASQVEHYQLRLAQAADDKERALDEGLARLEEQLMLVGDQRDDLQQRIRFLERQVVRLRRDADLEIPTASVEVQTDSVIFGSGSKDMHEHLDEAVVEVVPLSPIIAPPIFGHLNNMLSGDKVVQPKKRSRFLGHFQGLITTERVGKVRGIAWTHSCISTLYFDKVINDAVADREGNPRAELCEFAYDWHLTRFGLRNLAELNLLDLISSARHHHKTSVRVRWFAQFVGLVEVGERIDTLQHASFYIFCLQQLAYPNALMALFPEADDIPVLVRATVVQDAVRAIFRYLNDVDSAIPFLTRNVEPITDTTTDPVTVPGDLLIKLLMAEFQKRVDRNVAHLRALFRAGDLDNDGRITYDEFCSLLRHAAPDIQERVVSKMYTEAVRALPDGVTMVDMDTFVATCRCYNFDRWKIELPTQAMLVARPSTAAISVLKNDEFQSNQQNSKTMLRLLDSAVDALDPPLEDQLWSVRETGGRGERGAEALIRIEAQAVHFKSVYEAHDDVHAAWLAFRILVSSISAALTAPPQVAPSPGAKPQRVRLVPDTPWRSGATHPPPLSSSGPWDPGSVMSPVAHTPSDNGMSGHATPTHGSTPTHGHATPTHGSTPTHGTSSSPLGGPSLMNSIFSLNHGRSKTINIPPAEGGPRGAMNSAGSSIFSRPKAVTIGGFTGGAFDPSASGPRSESPPHGHDLGGSDSEHSPSAQSTMMHASSMARSAAAASSAAAVALRRRKSTSCVQAGPPDTLTQVLAEHLEHRGPLGPTLSLMPPSVAFARTSSNRPVG